MRVSFRRSAAIRPGVPHASAHDCASSPSARVDVPPMNAWHDSPGTCAPTARHTSRTCVAISRVGSTMSACGAGAPGCSSSSATTANAHVFPVPDCACAIRSTPSWAIGIACAWIGAGRTKFDSARPRSTGAEMPSSSKAIASAGSSVDGAAAAAGAAAADFGATVAEGAEVFGLRKFQLSTAIATSATSNPTSSVTPSSEARRIGAARRRLRRRRRRPSARAIS